ncbi:MAG: hypothetical protein C4617_03275, partial [Candidatus Liberibacter europaeus]
MDKKQTIEEYRIASLEENHKELKVDIKELSTKIDGFQSNVNQGFEKVNDKIHAVELSFEKVNDKIHAVELSSKDAINTQTKWFMGIIVSIFVSTIG